MSTARQYCTVCRRHYPGGRSACPVDGKPLTGVPENLLQEGSLVDGKYMLTHRLAVGGMASIFRARRLDSGAPVAIKLLLGRFLGSPQVVNQFFQEARIIGKLRHPNVVELHDFGRTEEGYIYMAMELLGGETLAEHLWNGSPPPVDRALRIFFQVAEALAAAHALGIVHADLKASNVLFVSSDRDDERVKVLDFGIARLHDPSAWRATAPAGELLSGTPQYMSPEQVAGEQVDPRTDVYAAGVLLFQLLTGRVPFDHEDPLEVCRMQREQRPPRLAEIVPDRRIPFAVEQLVERLLRKDPEGRPASAAELVEESKEILRRAGSPTTPSRALEPEPEPEDLPEAPARFTAPEPEPEPEDEDEPASEAPIVRKRFITLLDMAFQADERPFSLLDEDTMTLLTAPIVERVSREVRAAGGAIIERDTYRLRALFGMDDARPIDGAQAVDVALAFLARVESAELALGVGLRARCGLATGPLYHCPEDGLPPALLVRGSFADLAARLVQRSPWGGLALDGATFSLRARQLTGAHMRRLKARRSPQGVKIYWYRPTRERRDATPNPSAAGAGGGAP